MIRSDSLYFYAQLILKVPFSEDREESLFKIGCNKRMNIQNKLSLFLSYQR